MKKKELTIEDRVDLLLEHGVDRPEKWSAVNKYVEPDNYDKHHKDDGSFNEVCFDTLLEHHEAETKFLFEMLRSLVKRVELMDEQMASIVVDPSMEDDD